MARAWLDVFAGWEGDAAEPVDGTAEDDNADRGRVLLPEGLTLDDPIASLNTSRKVRSALRKLEAERVREVATLDPVVVNRTRGVAHKTRKQIVALRAAILERFADELNERTTTTQGSTRPTTTPATVTAGAATVVGSLPDLDRLGLQLIPPRGQRGREGKVSETVRAVLGLQRPGGAHPILDDWPSLTDVSDQVGITRGGVSHTFQRARDHWAAQAELQDVADDLLAIVADLGGVAGVSELAAPLIDARGSGSDGDDARALAIAVIRAVVESSAPIADAFTTRRSGRRTILAINGTALRRLWDDGALDPDGFERDVRHRLASFDAVSLIDLAVALGRRADELVADEELVVSSDALPALRAVRSAAGASLSDARLVRLAAAASDHAATNAASDLIPVQVSAEAALRWSRPLLVGARSLTPAELRDRVAIRFPHVTLPDRPALDAAIAAAGLPFVWSPTSEAFESTASAPGRLGTLSRVPSRLPTVYSAGGTTTGPADTPEAIAATAVEGRLQQSLQRGGLLVLRVPADRLRHARRELARFQTDPAAVEVVNLEALFLTNLRAQASARNMPAASWPKVEAADDRDATDWDRLESLAKPAVQVTIDDVCGRRRVLAWHPGALVRHGTNEAVAPLDQLCEAARSGDRPLGLLWLVVFGSSSEARPTVDGTPVPVLGPGEWVDLNDAWLNNAHRAGGLTA